MQQARLIADGLRFPEGPIPMAESVLFACRFACRRIEWDGREDGRNRPRPFVILQCQ